MSNSSTKESLEPTPEKDVIATTAPFEEHSNQDNNNINRLNKESDSDQETVHNVDTLLDHKDSGSHVDGDVNDNNQNIVYDSETQCGDHNSTDANKSIKTQKIEYSNNSNNTRTLTQQNSLVAPSEVQISVSPSLTAEPVLTLNGTLCIIYLV